MIKKLNMFKNPTSNEIAFNFFENGGSTVQVYAKCYFILLTYGRWILCQTY